jgi:hypothetical protein
VSVVVLAASCTTGGDRGVDLGCGYRHSITASPSQVPPGGAIVVQGEQFGDRCSVGGSEALGRPLDGVEPVAVVRGEERTVAVVDADEAYGFTVEVQVPPSLGEGSGEIRAVVRDEPAMGDVGALVDVRGEAVATRDAELVHVDLPGPGSSRWWLGLAVLGVLAALLALRTLVWRRRSVDIAEPFAD